jgi:UDPglucose 6-dehydrogenase
MQGCSVIGLGKLGLPLAAVLASSGFKVVGADVNQRTVDAVQRREIVSPEPGLNGLLSAIDCSMLSATTDIADAVLQTDVSFVIVPTPSDPDHRFSLRFVESACRKIAQGLASKSTYHLVVITSTVLPGATRGVIAPLLEAESGKRLGSDFGICYSPEFIALGNALQGMQHPEFLLVGEYDSCSGDKLIEVYSRIYESLPPIARMSCESAELAKLSVNTFVTTKISYANMIAAVCERLPGAQAQDVLGAIGLDPRIGSAYLKPGLGYGGPCFPRDNLALIAAAASVGCEMPIARATHDFNELQAPRLADRILATTTDGTVGILGLSYKPNTDVIECSQGVEVAQFLAARGVQVKVYDPVAQKSARAALGDTVEFAESMHECAASADVLVIATAWDEFKDLSQSDLKQSLSGVTIFDCWDMLDPHRFERSVRRWIPGSAESPVVAQFPA